MSDDWTKVHCEMDSAFQRSEVRDATPDQWEQWLQNLCTGNIPNEAIRHREIVRGITINHLQMAKMICELQDTIQRLNAANNTTQQLVVRLTWIAVVVGTIQAIAAVIPLVR